MARKTRKLIPKRRRKLIPKRRQTRPTYAQLRADHDALRAASDMQDGDMERLRERIRFLEERASRKVYPIWKTGRGESIPVNELDEGHLRNAISYCTRRLLGGLSNTVYLDNIHYLIRGLADLMEEAKRRGIRV